VPYIGQLRVLRVDRIDGRRAVVAGVEESTDGSGIVLVISQPDTALTRLLAVERDQT